MLGWYAVLAVSIGVYIGTLPGASAGCQEPCDSDRSGMLALGAYVALPALFAALLLSLVVLWLVATRVQLRSVLVAGTLSATPALLVAGVLGAIALSS
jgi:hypothetical protein